MSTPAKTTAIFDDDRPAITTPVRERILALHAEGITDLAELVRRTGSRPSHVAQVLHRAGLVATCVVPAGERTYGRFFRDVLRFGTVAQARESCMKLSRLYAYFERLGDRAGQHHATVLALTGRNRARWAGRTEVAEVFAAWLMEH